MRESLVALEALVNLSKVIERRRSYRGRFIDNSVCAVCDPVEAVDKSSSSSSSSNNNNNDNRNDSDDSLRLAMAC